MNSETITNQQLLELDVDVLIPAALENQITAQNANRIQAPVIIVSANGPTANGPTTSDADQVLNAKGKLVVPDILANAGGVTVGYFEWVQNRTGYSWTEEQVHTQLREIMVREFNAVYDLMQQKQIDMRTAAYTIALNRIGAAVAAQGTMQFFTGEEH